MNNQKYINNLMVIHRDLSHMITKETRVQFDKTITAAIIALSKVEEIDEEELGENNSYE